MKHSKIVFQLVHLLDWCGRSLRDRCRRVDGPVHVMFCMADHFEPGTRDASPAEEKARMDLLLSAYPKLAGGHRDHDGCPPKRTWFLPPHYHRAGNLPALVQLCQEGYGEIELHLHHGKQVPDTAANLRATILRTVEEYGAFGVFGSEDGRKRYAFIHGDWALDNSRDGAFCGVNSELTVLRETGCYADLTFPAMGVPGVNPARANRIYYATDDPARPRSHARGRVVASRGEAGGDLMMIQGPVHPYLVGGRISGFRMIGDSVCNDRVGVDGRRIDSWVKTGIHIVGKRNWVFIKTHTHGATEAPVVLGDALDQAFAHMESHYNDSVGYCLHYVTSREMYNMIKAGEAGEPGDDPAPYRDYRIAAPRLNPRGGMPDASEELQALVGKTYWG